MYSLYSLLLKPYKIIGLRAFTPPLPASPITIDSCRLILDPAMSLQVSHHRPLPLPSPRPPLTSTSRIRPPLFAHACPQYCCCVSFRKNIVGNHLIKIVALRVKTMVVLSLRMECMCLLNPL